MTHRQPHGPQFLSVGNVISAGIRIYRDHFQLYFLEILKGYLWALIPVYGWAKFMAIQGMISRLGFYEITEKPESLPEARLRVKPRLWSFLLTGLFTGFIFLGFILVVAIAIGILTAITLVTSQTNSPIPLITTLLIVLVLLVSLFAYVWLYSRLAFAEVAIAVELVNKPMQAIRRSWQLTEGYVIKLQTIYFVAFLITLPTAIIGNLGTLILGEESPAAPFVDLALSILTGAFIAPFWQSIKAVIFYDLKVRKEGLDLLDTTPEDSLE